MATQGEFLPFICSAHSWFPLLTNVEMLTHISIDVDIVPSLSRNINSWPITFQWMLPGRSYTQWWPKSHQPVIWSPCTTLHIRWERKVCTQNLNESPDKTYFVCQCASFFAQSQALLKLTLFITDKYLLNFIIDDTLFAASADEEIAGIHPRRQVWHDSPHFFLDSLLQIQSKAVRTPGIVRKKWWK